MCCYSHRFIVFVKQKTAYVIRISYWSSDVCSSDLVVDAAEVDHAGDHVAPGVDALGIGPGDVGIGRQPDHAAARRQRLDQGVGLVALVRQVRKGDVEGKSESVSVDLGGRGPIKKKRL